jgi:putative sugar O-methyltransferase
MKKNISQKNIELIKQFILNTENFWEDHKIINLDYKHRKILKTFNKKYKDNLELFSKQIINWEEQTDQGHPYQINLKSIKYYGFTKNILDGLKYIYQIISKKNYDRNSFIDDIEIIKLKKGVNFFNKIDISSRPDKPPIYFFKENFETNNRWNRYVYLASRIINSKLLNSKSKNWLDIGSYFGGLQSILKKDLKNQNFYLLDFNHQLCRSYVYLKQIYPDSNHILPKHIHKKNKTLTNSFTYVPIGNFKKLKNIKFDLVTNFFSFGEMSRFYFDYYMKSKIINNAKILYLVNRFVSSPWFEPTYMNDLNFMDYENSNFNTKFIDVFPIHHYQNIKRELFGRTNYRPISSPYFEKIMVNKKNLF